MASFDWLKTTPQYITFLIQTYFHWLPGKLVHKSVGDSLWFSSGEELCPLLVREPFMFSVGDVFFRLTSEEHQLWACFYEWSALPFGKETWWDWNIHELAIIYQTKISMTQPGKIWFHQQIKSGKHWKEDHVGTLEGKRLQWGVWRCYDKLVLLRKPGSMQDVRTALWNISET